MQTTHGFVDLHVGLVHITSSRVPTEYVKVGEHLLICTSTAITKHRSHQTIHETLGIPGVVKGETLKKKAPKIQVIQELTELLLLLEEGAVEGAGDGVEDELEAVEDLHGPAALHPDDAPEHPRRLPGPSPGGGGGAVPGAGGLRLDAGVVVGDVHDDERVELEGEPAARGGGGSRGSGSGSCRRGVGGRRHRRSRGRGGVA